MTIDISHRSTELLERLANSIYDRDLTNQNPFFFNIAEVHIVEKWIYELVAEIKKAHEGRA